MFSEMFLLILVDKQYRNLFRAMSLILSTYRFCFLSVVMSIFNDRIMLYPAATKVAFCSGCVRYTIIAINITCVLVHF